MKNQKQFLILLILSILLILIASLTPGNGKSLGQWDKVGHFTMYFLLSIPIAALCKNNIQSIIGLVLAIGLGISLECIQEYVPGRGYENLDILANSTGSIAGAIFFYFKNEWICSWF